MIALHTVTIAPPAALPVTLDELKIYLGVQHNQADAILTRLIPAAVDIVETAIGVAGIRRTLEQRRNGFPDGRSLILGPAPLVSVASVSYRRGGESLTLATSLYRVIVREQGVGFIQIPATGSWPVTDCDSDSVQVRYVAGIADGAAGLPALFVTAVLEVAGRMFDTRGAMDGAMLARTARDVAAPLVV